MHIQYYGLSCLKLTTKPGGRGAKDITIVINPFTRTKDLTPPQLASADIVIAATKGMRYYSEVAQKADLVEVVVPGEYAVHGVQIVGLQSSGSEANTTIYVLESEGLKVGIVTALATPLSAKHYEELASTDVLIVAAGGDDVISAEQAAEIARKIEPAYVIPVQTALKGNVDTKEYDSVGIFCEKIGNCPKELVQKVVIKDKECVDKSLEVILMQP